jgi:hypothetical protein
MRHPGRVHLAYIDESYSADEFVLAVLIVDGECARAVREGLDEVVRAAHRRHGVAPSAEIHAYDLMQATGQWAGLTGQVRARTGILDAVVEVIVSSGAELVECRVAARAVRDSGASAPAVSIAYGLALKGAVIRLQARCERDGRFVALIADDVDEEDLHRHALRAFQLEGLPGREQTRADRIVDTLYFGPSKASRLLQAADVVAYVLRRVGDSQVGDQRAVRAARAMADRLATRIVETSFDGA